MKGFTLIELIFGISIVGVIISTIIFGSLVVKSCDRINEKGLKQELEQIWNGPNEGEIND